MNKQNLIEVKKELAQVETLLKKVRSKLQKQDETFFNYKKEADLYCGMALRDIKNFKECINECRK